MMAQHTPLARGGRDTSFVRGPGLHLVPHSGQLTKQKGNETLFCLACVTYNNCQQGIKENSRVFCRHQRVCWTSSAGAFLWTIRSQARRDDGDARRTEKVVPKGVGRNVNRYAN